jgi:hypothetical protein
MAIGTDELTLRDFVEDDAPAVAAQERADLGDLRRAQEVVPRHGQRVEGGAAIGAGLPCLELPIPLGHLEMSRTVLAEATVSRAWVISRVVARVDRP